MLRSVCNLYALRDEPEAKINIPQYLPTAKTEYLAAVERNQQLVNEADVVRASVQQFINPVNIVFEDLYQGDKILCNSEVPSIGTTQSTGSKTQPGSRFDLRWSLGNKEEVFAILEFKNTNVIHWQDFRAAACTSEDLPEKIARDESRLTLLASNAMTIAKQAADDMQPTSKHFVGGTFFQEVMEDRTSREALLGFLVKTIEAHKEQ